ncbi:hypothetical protein [Desulfopila sp. IMCC35008]|uniref:hypothetical protein n=1 Tax=Desulfopila sp. IMCC35008 TaxID=2653858 RepID=UPI0013D02184|nr:hypothetical protein [Desulfopila sp. IMCC35008]
MRFLHRDIGFFVIGLTVIYGISGIVLTYRDTGFLKSESYVQKYVEPGLTFDQLGKALHLRGITLVDQDDKVISFLKGSYNKETGLATYVNEEIPVLLRALNTLHIASSKDARSLFNVVFAGMLLFLAISSFWMYRPGTRLFKRGLVTALAGMVLSILLVAM